MSARLLILNSLTTILLPNYLTFKGAYDFRHFFHLQNKNSFDSVKSEKGKMKNCKENTKCLMIFEIDKDKRAPFLL